MLCSQEPQPHPLAGGFAVIFLSHGEDLWEKAVGRTRNGCGSSVLYPLNNTELLTALPLGVCVLAVEALSLTKLGWPPCGCCTSKFKYFVFLRRLQLIYHFLSNVSSSNGPILSLLLVWISSRQWLSFPLHRKFLREQLGKNPLCLLEHAVPELLL